MATGMVFAALAFAAATLVEVNVMRNVVVPAPAGNCLLQVYNLAGGDVTVNVSGSNLFPEPISNFKDPVKYELIPLGVQRRTLKVEVTKSGKTSTCDVQAEEEKAYTLILHSDGNSVTCKLVEDNIHKSNEGNPFLRFLNTQPEAIHVITSPRNVEFLAEPNYSVTLNQSMHQGDYTAVGCTVGSNKCSNFSLGLLDFGASYTFILTQDVDRITAHKMIDVNPSDVHIAWQIPQYVLMTAGEVMFSITGLEFSYSQAPANMKSVLQAGWLLTVAFGNVIVLIVAEGAGLEQWKEFLLFVGLLLGVCVIFSIMAHFYTYVDPEQLEKLEMEDSDKEDDDDDDKYIDKKKNDDGHLKKAEKSTRL